jgi:hypothetical protein
VSQFLNLAELGCRSVQKEEELKKRFWIKKSMVKIEMGVALLDHTINIITNLSNLYNTIITIEIVIVNKINRLVLQCSNLENGRMKAG